MYGDMYEYMPPEEYYPDEQPESDAECPYCHKRIRYSEEVVEVDGDVWHEDCLRKHCAESDYIRDKVVEQYIGELGYEYE